MDEKFKINDGVKAKQQAIELISKPQKQVEFARYKQDCRKRAIELSKDLFQMEWAAWDERKRKFAEKNENFNETMPNILSVANKYYDWLISISND